MGFHEWWGKVDKSGRFTLPSPLPRKTVREVLFVYLPGEEQLRGTLIYDPEPLQINRCEKTCISKGQIDKRGRIVIPATFRHLVGIEKTVVVAFSEDCGYFELWESKNWLNFLRRL